MSAALTHPVTTERVVYCSYCGHRAQYLPNSAKVYSGRDFGPVYYCAKDRAWVGCHKGTNIPKGTLANEELRESRKFAHAHFDELWKSLYMTRAEAYAWFSSEMDRPVDQCHIALLDSPECVWLATRAIKKLKELKGSR